jgi:CHAD domain-containing protein
MATSSKWIEGIGPDSTVEDAARRSLEPRLTAVSHLLPMAAHLAEHDIEHVHRLRVATRRAVAALKLYRDCVPRKQLRWVKKRFRKIRRAAGDARDLDVLADRLAREYGERVTAVIDLIARERASVQPTIVRIAERCRNEDRLVRKTAALLQSIRSPKADDRCAEPKTFHDWAADRLASVAEEFTAAMSTESSSTTELHQFRIRAKALRYAIELVASAFDRNLRKKLYPLVEELQERLGRVQDHVTAGERCRNWATNTSEEFLQETLRELAEAEDRGLADAVREFHAWWTDDRVQLVRSLLSPPTGSTQLPEAIHQT